MSYFMKKMQVFVKIRDVKKNTSNQDWLPIYKYACRCLYVLEELLKKTDTLLNYV